MACVCVYGVYYMCVGMERRRCGVCVWVWCIYVCGYGEEALGVAAFMYRYVCVWRGDAVCGGGVNRWWYVMCVYMCVGMDGSGWVD